MTTPTFDDWIRELDEDVIQGEHGFEDGEFTVYREQWRPDFDRGLTPSQAFRAALDEFAEARRKADEAKRLNWERIQREDAAAIKAQREGQR